MSSSQSCIPRLNAKFLEDRKENFLAKFCGISCQLVRREFDEPPGVAGAEYVDGCGFVPLEGCGVKEDIPFNDE